jgi:YesN/AraC family two-component response regulator
MEALQQQDAAVSILVVEDDKSTRDMLCLMIKTKLPANSIYPAEDGRIGVELFKKHAPGIVITDINMPVMNGIEMAKEIKAMKPDTRFIVLTAYSNQIYLENFQKIGFRAYILKPIDFKKLFTAINDCAGEIMLGKAVP